MKKARCLLLSLAALLLLTVFACAEEMPAIGGHGIISLVPMEGGVLVYTTGQQAYLFDPEQRAYTPVPITLDGESFGGQTPLFSELFAGPDDTLYGAIRRDGVFIISRGKWAEAAEPIAMTTLGEMPYDRELPAAMSFLCSREGIIGCHGTTLICWNPDTGAAFTWQNSGFERLTVAGDRLFAVTPGQSPHAVEVNIASQSTTTLFSLPRMVERFCASPDGKWVAWLSNGLVTARSTRGLEKQGYLPHVPEGVYGPCCLTEDGTFLLFDGASAWMVPLSDKPQPAEKELTVAATFFEADETIRFRRKHAEIFVKSQLHDLTNMLTPAKVGEAVRSGDRTVDVYLLSTEDLGYRALLEKGFCADLSGDEELTALISAMPEIIRQAVTADGKICAVPYSGSWKQYMPLAISTTALEAAGLTMDDVPDNVDELLDALLNWIKDGTLDNIRLRGGIGAPGESVTELDSLFAFTMPLSCYLTYTGCDTAYPDLDNPAFRSLMRKADALRKALHSRECPDMDAPILFPRVDMPFAAEESKFFSDVRLLTLVPYAGDRPRAIAYLDVAVLNPLSENKETALTYLKSLLTDMDARTALYFWPERAAAQEDPAKLENICVWEEMLAEYTHLAADPSLDDVQRREAQETLERIQYELPAIQQDRWIVSQETIDAYRSGIELVTISTNDLMNQLSDAGGDTIRERYLDGQADIDMLVDTYARIIRTIAMENGCMVQ